MILLAIFLQSDGFLFFLVKSRDRVVETWHVVCKDVSSAFCGS